MTVNYTFAVFSIRQPKALTDCKSVCRPDRCRNWMQWPLTDDCTLSLSLALSLSLLHRFSDRISPPILDRLTNPPTRWFSFHLQARTVASTSQPPFGSTAKGRRCESLAQSTAVCSFSS